MMIYPVIYTISCFCCVNSNTLTNGVECSVGRYGFRIITLSINNNFKYAHNALLICFVVFKCHLLPVAMVRTRKIVMKSNKKRKERKLCCLFIIFLLWDMQQVYRDLWVHPLNEERSQKGEYYTHYVDHRLFDDRFFELYRMTVAQFDEILHKIRHLLQKRTPTFAMLSVQNKN